MVKDLADTHYIRESYLFKCEWILRWCGMGNPCCPNMSIISKRYCGGDRQPIFHHHVPVVRMLVELRFW